MPPADRSRAKRKVLHALRGMAGTQGVPESRPLIHAESLNQFI